MVSQCGLDDLLLMKEHPGQVCFRFNASTVVLPSSEAIRQLVVANYEEHLLILTTNYKLFYSEDTSNGETCELVEITNDNPWFILDNDEYIVEIGIGGEIFRTNHNRYYFTQFRNDRLEFNHNGFSIHLREENGSWKEVSSTVTTAKPIQFSSYQHGAILLNNNKILQRGPNSYQQLGVSEPWCLEEWTEHEIFGKTPQTEEDFEIEILPEEKVLKVVTGFWKTFFITSRRVLATGSNNYLSLGYSQKQENPKQFIVTNCIEGGNFNSMPTRIVDAFPPCEIVDIVCGNTMFTCFLESSRKRFYVCGTIADEPYFGDAVEPVLDTDETIDRLFCDASVFGIIIVTNKKKVFSFPTHYDSIAPQLITTIKQFISLDERMFGKFHMHLQREYRNEKICFWFEKLTSDLLHFWDKMRMTKSFADVILFCQ